MVGRGGDKGAGEGDGDGGDGRERERERDGEKGYVFEFGGVEVDGGGRRGVKRGRGDEWMGCDCDCDCDRLRSECFSDH